MLDEMKEENVVFDNYSYRLCINVFGVMNDFEGIGEILRDMEIVDWNIYVVVVKFYIDGGDCGKVVEFLRMFEDRLESKDGEGYNYFIMFYFKLGDKGEVLRLWELEKDVCKRWIN